MSRRWRIALILIAVIGIGVAISYPIQYFRQTRTNNTDLADLAAMREKVLEEQAGASASPAPPQADGTAGAAADARPEATGGAETDARPQYEAETQRPGGSETESAPTPGTESNAAGTGENGSRGDAQGPGTETAPETSDAVGDADRQSGTAAPGGPGTPGETPASNVTAVPGGAETPSETDAPGETPAPNATAAPGGAETPSETVAPGEAPAPDMTAAPGGAVTPSETAVPGDVGSPAEGERAPTLEELMILSEPWFPVPTATPRPTRRPDPTPGPTMDRELRLDPQSYYSKEKLMLDEDAILPELRAIYRINPDLVAWLEIPGTDINYPVVQTEDSDFYLTHDFYREENKNGQIILDTKCDPYTPSYNLIISGHNMATGSMFGNLDYYKSKSYWSTRKILKLDSLMERREYVIFAAFYSADYDEYEDGFRYNADVQYKIDAEQWLAEIKKYQLYDTGIDVQFGDEFVTLTTCNKERRKDGRFVLIARRIREGEEIK